MLFDDYAKPLIDAKPNLLVAWYLMASYAYYIEDDPILSDGFFDHICKELLAKWDTIEHMHKHLFTKEDLEAGTCLIREYPGMVSGGVGALRATQLS